MPVTPTIAVQKPSITSLQQQAVAVLPLPPDGISAVYPTVAQVSYQQPTENVVQGAESLPQAPAQMEFCLAEFVAEVQARNPSLQAMMAAAQATAERYPQVVALDDPMFNANLAPASLGSSTVEGAYTLELSQKFPWFGKRAARGRAAKADASSAYADAEDARLRLIETAELAFYDYYLVARQRDLLGWNTDVMRQFRDTAQSKYRANQVTQQDILQADVELTQLERRQLELERMKTVAMARINTLLHQPTNTALPPPPRQLSFTDGLPDVNQLQQIAAGQRPELASLASQIVARQADLCLAQKQYYPDTEVYGHYDTYWQPASTQGDLRGEVGARVNLPIYYGRLSAGVREADDRVNQKRAEYDQKLLDIQYEVQQAYAEVYESQQALKLYTDKLVPIAEQNVAAARSNYDVGKSSFLDLAVAQRQLIDVREKHQEVLAEYHQRVASLKRAIGGPLPSSQGIEAVPAPSPN
jgi:outer membrane protein TolC